MLWILRTGAPWRDLPGCFGFASDAAFSCASGAACVQRSEPASSYVETTEDAVGDAGLPAAPAARVRFSFGAAQRLPLSSNRLAGFEWSLMEAPLVSNAPPTSSGGILQTLPNGH